MPARQRGFARKRGGKWLAGWYDEGKQRTRGGFETKTAALDYANTKADEVVARLATIRFGDETPTQHRPGSVDEMLDLFLERHGATVDPATKRKLERQLRSARKTFGGRHPKSLHRLELEDWRATLSPGSRHYVFRAFRQALAWAHGRNLIERDASAGIKNPKPKRNERRPIVPFESWDEVEAVSDELHSRYRTIPTFAVGTGLRPEEWIALERGDMDREQRIIRVCRRFTGGELKPGTKTEPERFVPLRQHVLDAIDAMPPRIDTKLLFPAPRGGYIDLERFRHREWAPALRAAGLESRGPYTMRHTFATWAIEDGQIPLAQLATIMGTSIRELEDTYHRWLRRTNGMLRAAFDAYDAQALTR